jgi:hypothetical protein
MDDARLLARLVAERDALARASTAPTAGQALLRTRVRASRRAGRRAANVVDAIAVAAIAAAIAVMLGAVAMLGGVPTLSERTRRLVAAVLILGVAAAVAGLVSMRSPDAATRA